VTKKHTCREERNARKRLRRELDADLFGDAKWEGKQHSSFERRYRKGLQWLERWQSKQTQRFAVKFYNCREDNLLHGKKNRGGRARTFDEVIGKRCLASFQQPTDGCRDCTGPAWEWWTIGSARSSSSSGVESGEVRGDTRDQMAIWAPPSSYFNLTPEEMNTC
jgi:hypothetical protein